MGYHVVILALAPSRKNILGGELQRLRALLLTAKALARNKRFFLLVQKQIATMRSNV